MIYQFPNLLQTPQPAAAAARKNEPNLMSHKTDFSELSKQARYCQRRRPTTGSIFQLFSLLLAATKSLPSKSQPTWETPGWIGTPANASKHCTSRVRPVLGSDFYTVLQHQHATRIERILLGVQH